MSHSPTVSWQVESPFSPLLVYNAVGLCAFQLYDDLDYDSWYQTHLLKELTIQDPR